MKFLQLTCAFYCGIDLHSKSMVICIMAADGRIVLLKRIENKIEELLLAIAPYRESIVLGVESTFNWYWLVDGCRDHDVEIYLGHTHYMMAISVGKTKNDKLDAKKISLLLRAGLFPAAHAVMADKRAIRDLLRHRNRLVHMRSELLTQTKTTYYQQGDLKSAGLSLRGKKTREDAASHIENEHIRLGAMASMEVVTSFDKQIKQIETELQRHSMANYGASMKYLMSIPGVGPIISMTILYETDTLSRFKRRQDYSSYCRLARPEQTSDGKCVGTGNAKCGSSYLKWAFMEIITNAVNNSEPLKAMQEELKKRYKPLKARAILANRFCAAVYYMLKHNKEFDEERFCKGITIAAA